MNSQIRPLDKWWSCPLCKGALHAGGKDKGEGIKVCPNCGASWYILLCRRPSKQ